MNNTPDSKLEYLLEHFKGLGCKGVGEVLPRMDFDDPKLMNLYRAAEITGLPLLFDMTSSPKRSYGVSDEPGQSAFMNGMLDSGRITERVYDMIARENAKKLLNI